jgi:signal transduction histidine kinase
MRLWIPRMIKNMHDRRPLSQERTVPREVYGPSVAPVDWFGRRPIANSLLIAVGYYVGSEIGFLLTPAGHAIATYWPPNAILMASLLLLPPRTWWRPITAVLGAHLLIQSENGIPVGTALGWFIGNASEALLGALLLYRFSNRKSLFSSVQDTLTFLLLGAFLAPFLTAFFDAGVVVFTKWGGDYWGLWTTRLFSNMLATLTLVPAIVNFRANIVSRLRQSTPILKAEAVLLLLAIILVTALVYGTSNPWPNSVPLLVYAPLPLLLWASLRFGAAGLGVSVSTMAIISFHYISEGPGLSSTGSMIEHVLFLQLLLGAVTVPLMLLNAVLAERQLTEQKLRDSRNRLIHAQEEERARIARELHDDIGQQLALVTLNLRQLCQTFRKQGQASGIVTGIESLIPHVARISEATRALSRGLHPVQLEHLGLVPALKSFCSEIERNSSIKIRLDKENSPDYLEPEMSLCLFRVAQEALHNVVKHSHASSSRVELLTRNGRVIMRISDNGVGFIPERDQTAGLGLINMRERLRLLSGSIKIHSRPMKGTVVEASLPWNGRTHARAI